MSLLYSKNNKQENKLNICHKNILLFSQKPQVVTSPCSVTGSYLFEYHNVSVGISYSIWYVHNHYIVALLFILEG